MANIILRVSGSIASTGATVKGSALTNYEVDNNFSNLNIAVNTSTNGLSNVITGLASVNANVGVLSNLLTSNTSNLVSAINELKSGGGAVGATGATGPKNSTDTIVNLGSITGATTLNLALGNAIFKGTLTGSVTFSVSNAYSGNSFSVLLTQGGSGSYTASWPGTFKFAGASSTLSTSVGSIDFVNAFYDGTNYYAVLSKGYA
jgi:hypothetical protein